LINFGSDLKHDVTILFVTQLCATLKLHKAAGHDTINWKTQALRKVQKMRINRHTDNRR